MAVAEKRTLDITARLRDFFSRPLDTMGKNLDNFTKRSAFGFKSLIGHFLGLRSQIGGLLAAYAGIKGLEKVSAIAATPVRRLGTATDVAQAAVFLASDAASFVCGASLPVDGGFLAT